MTTSYFAKTTLSVPYKETIYIGTSNGVTKIEEGPNTETDIIAETSTDPGVKVLSGSSSYVLSVETGNVIAVVTQGGQGTITYLSSAQEKLGYMSNETLTRPIGSGQISKGSVRGSYGAVVMGGDVHVLSKDIGVYMRSIFIVNDDDQVDFGENGDIEVYSLPDSQVGTVSNPEAIQVYNDTDYAAGAKVVISFTGKDEDEYLEVSDTLGGTYYKIREHALKFPRDVDWSNGQHQNTQVVSSYVTTSGETGPFVYTSPVLDMYEETTLRNYRTFWVSDEPERSSIDEGSVADGAMTVKVRQALTAPSGSWAHGQLPSAGDAIWGVGGSLSYQRVANYNIDVVSNRYVQFEVTFNPDFLSGFLIGSDDAGATHYVTESGNIGSLPKLHELGLEVPTYISSISARSSRPVYVRANIPTPASGTRIRNTLRKAHLDVWWEFPEDG